MLASCSKEPAPQGPTASISPAPPATTPAAATSSIRFTDITRDAGIDVTTACGVLPSTQILEVNGSGLALFDYDRDHDLDVFIGNGATLSDPVHGFGCRLYRNEGQMKFSDVTVAAKIDVATAATWPMGAAVGDVDGDGFEDLFIACFGPDILLHNNGDGTFSDASQRAGIAKESSWGTGAAFGDLDNDGDLDLYVANYLEFDPKHPPPRAEYKGQSVLAGPHGLKPEHDFLYLNDGAGVFREASTECGARPEQPAFGLNVVILDFDNDGSQDIYVANDSMPGFLFRNQGASPLAPGSAGGSNSTLRFEDIGVISGIASNGDGGNQAAMGIAIADVDDNGFPDKFVTVFSSDTNTLHLNVNGRLFEDRSTSYGLGMISRPYLGWACGFFDFDLDGDEDLLMFNGHVYPEATIQSMDSDYLQTPLLFTREGKKFRRVEASEAGAWLGEKHRDRSAVFGDLDSDGDIDVIVSELNGPIRVLCNGATATPTAHWLEVELRDERPDAKNRTGLGARLELADGDRTLRRWLFSGGGFQSSSPPMAHFGLANAAHPVSLIIRWPDGLEQRVNDIAPDRQLIVRHP
ncbi:MAG TPA: CRTAC1 family protein [Phycisphaerales bacterium]|nr:CRTAC1 family protein [Phycisphaerales bacterium]